MADQALLQEERGLGRAVVDTATQNLGTQRRYVNPDEARFYAIENATAGVLECRLPYDLTLFDPGFLLSIWNATLVGSNIQVKSFDGVTTHMTIDVGNQASFYIADDATLWFWENAADVRAFVS